MLNVNKDGLKLLSGDLWIKGLWKLINLLINILIKN
jgi:hypothetical protein